MKKARTDARYDHKSQLHIQRETLRTLSDSALAGIVGGDGEEDDEQTAVVLDNGSGGAP